MLYIYTFVKKCTQPQLKALFIAIISASALFGNGLIEIKDVDKLLPQTLIKKFCWKAIWVQIFETPL